MTCVVIDVKQAKLNHVALLLPSVQKAAEHLKPYDFRIGPAEQWEGEGTLEIYVGDHQVQSGTLLLMEPVKEGAYTRAMSKRGPGLHHIAVDVLNLEAYIGSLAGSGWLLHPNSLKTIRATKTAYLARPGLPTLIEVQERQALNDFPFFIESIQIPGLTVPQLKMFSVLGLSQVYADGIQLSMQIANRTINFKDLV